MKIKTILFILLFSVNFASAQSMLDMNEPSAIKKAKINRCIEVVNNENLWAMYYDTNGYQIKNSYYASKIDTNGNFIDGFYGSILYHNNHLGNKVEKITIDPIDEIPFSRRIYSYNENNQIILEELFNKKNSKQVTEKYVYADSLLVEKTFNSSSQSATNKYYYDETKRLCAFSFEDEKNKPVYTDVIYHNDTTFHKQYDATGKEIYQYYNIVRNKKLIEVYVWDKLKYNKYKLVYCYDPSDLLVKIERFDYNSNKTAYTCFKYE